MNNKCYGLLFLIITISLVLFSCNKKDTLVGPVESDRALYGKVIDEQGNPVAGVKVHYVPSLVDSGFAKSAHHNPLPTTWIQFSIPIETKVTLILLQHGTQDTIRCIYNNEVMAPGSHGVDITADHLTNGIYDYILKYDSTVLVSRFVLIQRPEALVNANPLTTTNNDGVFKLTYSQLGIGEVFETSSLSNPPIIYKKVISTSMYIFLVKDSYSNYLEVISVDTNGTTNKNFTIKKQ